MKPTNEQQWMEKLKKDGFTDLRVCPLPPNIDTGKHTHEQHTVHIILDGELTIIDNTGRKTYGNGDRVEFPAGTTHKAIGTSGGGSMIVGVKIKESSPFKSKHISVSINCPADKVYEFAANPTNLSKWASGLSSSITEKNGELIAESPLGKIKIKFTDKNRFGILDHDVILPSGETVYNPLRAFPNNDGCELVFTLYQRPEISDKTFEADAKLVKKDLEKLKRLMEGNIMQPQSIIKEVIVNAPRSKVWQAITDKNQMKQWYFDIAEFKAQVGFKFQFYAGDEKKKWLHLCKIKEVVSEKKLAYTWAYDGIPVETLVTFELFKEEENKTKVRLTHEGVENFPKSNADLATGNFVKGWESIIGDSLKKFAEKNKE